MSTENVRVRFAPSPTGHLHIGGARTAIYNWAFARHHQGAFILRIDDTDRQRSTDENTAAILRALEWLGMDWDEGPEVGGAYGPYFQTQRAKSHMEALQSLRDSGDAYACFCTADELATRRDPAAPDGSHGGYDRRCRSLPPATISSRIASGDQHVWRLAVPEERGQIEIDDAIRGEVRWPAEVMDDLVLVRSDGTPTYNFATVVDDWQMAISHVIRGDDHLSNTPRQVLIYEALGARVPRFAHMSLIFGSDGKRLSKRHGATSVEAYRDDGYLPEALLNYLALLGWSIDDKTTIFDRETLVRDFELGRVSRNPAVWDPDKLEWMNGAYIRGLSPTELGTRMRPYFAKAGLVRPDGTQGDDVDLDRVAPLLSERMKRLSDAVRAAAFLFGDLVEIEEVSRAKMAQTDGAAEILEAAAARLGALETFDAASAEAVLRSLPEVLPVKPKDVFQTVRVAVTGSTVSPPLFESLELLGRERALARLASARDSLDLADHAADPG